MTAPRDPWVRSLAIAQARVSDTVATEYGSLRVIGSADSLGRRIVTRCDCGNVRVYGADALNSGRIDSCGCRPWSVKPAPRPDSFAAEVVAAEGRGARQWHKGGGL